MQGQAPRGLTLLYGPGMADDFTIQHLDDFETNGRWSLVRRGLGVTSFGLNVVAIEHGYSIPEHHELERDQEEVFVVLEGDAVIVIEGEDYPAPREIGRAHV